MLEMRNSLRRKRGNLKHYCCKKSTIGTNVPRDSGSRQVTPILLTSTNAQKQEEIRTTSSGLLTKGPGSELPTKKLGSTL